jgi:hypothetical protein
MDAADVISPSVCCWDCLSPPRKQAGLTTSASSSANWLFSALPGKCARSPFPSFNGRNCFMAGTSVAARHPTGARR